MILDIEQKIRNLRELKNFTQDYMAQQLNISTRAYSKIETGETQLTINRLNEISTILEMGIEDILGFDKHQIFNNNPVNQQGGEYNAYNNTEVKFLKDLYERLLDEKEKVIKLLEEKTHNHL